MVLKHLTCLFITFLFNLLLLALSLLLSPSLSGPRPLGPSLPLSSSSPKLFHLVSVPFSLGPSPLSALHLTFALSPLFPLGEERGQA